MILVAGIGNIFLGDDGFGSEAARLIAGRISSPDVKVVDFGIRGLDFVYALMDGYDATIMIDAVQRGRDPGTVYVIEPDLGEIEDPAGGIDAHIMDPLRVLALARSMGADLSNVVLVGCEPQTFGDPGEGRLGLSPGVAAALDRACRLVEVLIHRMSHARAFNCVEHHRDRGRAVGEA
jgi:hydrogenase maturation protease